MDPAFDEAVLGRGLPPEAEALLARGGPTAMPGPADGEGCADAIPTLDWCGRTIDCSRCAEAARGESRRCLPGRVAGSCARG